MQPGQDEEDDGDVQMTGGYGHRGGRSRNQTGGGQDISRDPPSVQCNPDRSGGPVDRIAPATVEHATPRCAPSAQGQRFSDRYKSLSFG